MSTPHSLKNVHPSHRSMNWVWDTGLLDWVVETQPSGGGGAVTVADGADMAEGATTDVAVQGDNAGTISAKLRGLNKAIAAGLTVNAGTNLNTSALALEAGHLATIDAHTPALGQALAAASVPVVLTAAQVSTLTPLATVAVTSAGLTNLDVALSTRLKPADTLTKVATVDTITNTVTVTGPLTDTQLRATPPKISTKIALTASSPTTATVGVASAQAVATNSSRTGLVLTNLSANTISFGIGAAAVLNNGITLAPNGVWEMDEFTFSTDAINAIASSASSALGIQEFS